MTSDHLDGLTPQQDRAVLALINQPSVPKAAESCGVPERTLYRWLEEPVFREAFRSVRRKAFDQAASLNLRFMAMAVNTLAKVAADAHASDNARVAASSAILKFGRESIELDELLERVERLEGPSRGGGGGGYAGEGRRAVPWGT
jgi:hypothetical protein